MKTEERTFRRCPQAAVSVFRACGLALAIIFTIAVFPAGADTPPGPRSWREWRPAESVSPHEAFQKLLTSQTRGGSSRDTAVSETDITPEIEELARGLRHDPKLIFDYVHNHIDYTPPLRLDQRSDRNLLGRAGQRLRSGVALHCADAGFGLYG